MTFIKRVLLLTEVRYWLGVVRSEVWEDKDRRYHLWALVVEVLGLVLPASMLASLLWMGVFFQTGAPVVPTETEHVVVAVPVPQSPGPDFNTLGFCVDPRTTRVPLIMPVPEALGQVTLSRGLERVFWSGGDIAEFSWTDADGKDQGPVQVQMTAEAKKCFRSK